MTDFLTIDVEESRKRNCAINVIHREQEVHSYQLNIDSYQAILDNLPQDAWPEELVQYRGVSLENLPWELDIETVKTINAYKYRDQVRILIRTEMAEQIKSQNHLAAAKAQLSPEDLQAIIALMTTPTEQSSGT